jgi:hypothetical protein
VATKLSPTEEAGATEQLDLPTKPQTAEDDPDQEFVEIFTITPRDPTQTEQTIPTTTSVQKEDEVEVTTIASGEGLQKETDAGLTTGTSVTTTEVPGTDTTEIETHEPESSAFDDSDETEPQFVQSTSERVDVELRTDATTPTITGETVAAKSDQTTPEPDVAPLDENIGTTETQASTEEPTPSVVKEEHGHEMSMPFDDGVPTATVEAGSFTQSTTGVTTAEESTTAELPTTEEEELTTPRPKSGTDLPAMLTDIISTISSIVANGLFGDDGGKDKPEVTTTEKATEQTEVTEVSTVAGTTLVGETDSEITSSDQAETTTATVVPETTATEKGEFQK